VAILLYGSSTEILLRIRRKWSNEFDPTASAEKFWGSHINMFIRQF
jgi:hypothetical protein